jgi:streptogramin lyase
MTNDTPADIATGSDHKVPNPSTETAARTSRAAAAEKASNRRIKTTTKTTPKATQVDPEQWLSSPDTNSESSTDDGETDQPSSEYEEDPTSPTPL